MYLFLFFFSKVITPGFETQNQRLPPLHPPPHLLLIFKMWRKSKAYSRSVSLEVSCAGQFVFYMPDNTTGRSNLCILPALVYSKVCNTWFDYNSQTTNTRKMERQTQDPPTTDSKTQCRMCRVWFLFFFHFHSCSFLLSVRPERVLFKQSTHNLPSHSANPNVERFEPNCDVCT